MVARIYLSLGTNMGDRLTHLRRAAQGLQSIVTVEAVSPIYETKPWGLADQPDFLNLCVAATTTLAPRPLLAALKNLEVQLGRRPGLRWGPRQIDIDILFYDDLIVQEEGLTIPHPHLAERAFVLAPLADIAPDLIDPQTGRTVRAMLANTDATQVKKLSIITRE
ncbi:MAG: 2-amino-4-hydroxy-6-hydroxymethyldihydropteridine diphosphokinase [Chloroflexota bacterium]